MSNNLSISPAVMRAATCFVVGGIGYLISDNLCKMANRRSQENERINATTHNAISVISFVAGAIIAAIGFLALDIHMLQTSAMNSVKRDIKLAKLLEKVIVTYDLHIADTAKNISHLKDAMSAIVTAQEAMGGIAENLINRVVALENVAIAGV